MEVMWCSLASFCMRRGCNSARKRLHGERKRVSLGGLREVVLPGQLLHVAWLQLGTQAPAPGVAAGEQLRGCQMACKSEIV